MPIYETVGQSYKLLRSAIYPLLLTYKQVSPLLILCSTNPVSFTLETYANHVYQIIMLLSCLIIKIHCLISDIWTCLSPYKTAKTIHIEYLPERQKHNWRHLSTIYSICKPISQLHCVSTLFLQTSSPQDIQLWIYIWLDKASLGSTSDVLL